MKHSLELLLYIGKQVTASGKKRIIYSIVNILLMAAAVGSAIGIRTLYLGMGEINIFAAIIGIILLAALCIIFALDGVVGIGKKKVLEIDDVIPYKEIVADCAPVLDHFFCLRRFLGIAEFITVKL